MNICRIIILNHEDFCRGGKTKSECLTLQRFDRFHDKVDIEGDFKDIDIFWHGDLHIVEGLLRVSKVGASSVEIDRIFV